MLYSQLHRTVLQTIQLYKRGVTGMKCNSIFGYSDRYKKAERYIHPGRIRLGEYCCSLHRVEERPQSVPEGALIKLRAARCELQAVMLKFIGNLDFKRQPVQNYIFSHLSRRPLNQKY